MTFWEFCKCFHCRFILVFAAVHLNRLKIFGTPKLLTLNNKYLWSILMSLRPSWSDTAQKMKFSTKDFFSKCDQICNFLRIWSHLLEKSLMESSIFCVVRGVVRTPANIKLVHHGQGLRAFSSCPCRKNINLPLFLGSLLILIIRCQKTTQPAFTSSKLTAETLEGVKYVQS